jgi:hypothetical protein
MLAAPKPGLGKNVNKNRANLFVQISPEKNRPGNNFPDLTLAGV